MNRIVIIFLAILSTSFFMFIAVLFALPHPNQPFGFRSTVCIVMGIGLVWACISTWAGVYVSETAGIRLPMRLFPGPRPADPVELRVWIWKRNFYAAFMLILICMILISVSIWLQG